jgi:GNAT superfamily N-acetyltransferase
MRLEAHPDAGACLAAAAPVLEPDEARHNLIYGICSTLIDAPGVYREAHLWTLRADDEVVGAAVMTPPFNIVVARPLDSRALPFAARMLRDRDTRIPGVTGALPEVDAFAGTWAELIGAPARLRMSQGIYAARTVQPPSGVPGEARAARPGDRALIVGWLRAFQAEALEEDTPHVDLEEAVERRLRGGTAGIVLWEDQDEPVSLCGYGGRTPHGIRIGPVYTPPELRRRGYASALTAHVTQQALDGDRDYCFLYTDLANPTSNRIYMQIGYERVCDSAEYAFENRKGGV